MKRKTIPIRTIGLRNTISYHLFLRKVETRKSKTQECQISSHPLILAFQPEFAKRATVKNNYKR